MYQHPLISAWSFCMSMVTKWGHLAGSIIMKTCQQSEEKNQQNPLQKVKMVWWWWWCSPDDNDKSLSNPDPPEARHPPHRTTPPARFLFPFCQEATQLNMKASKSRRPDFLHISFELFTVCNSQETLPLYTLPHSWGWPSPPILLLLLLITKVVLPLNA